MNATQLAQQEANPIMIIDGIKVDRVQHSMEKIRQFQKVIQNTLVPEHDYGQLLWAIAKLAKPGREKIIMS